MKKILVTIIAILMALSLAACSAGMPAEEMATARVEEAAAPAAEEEAVAPTAPAEEIPITTQLPPPAAAPAEDGVLAPEAAYDTSGESYIPINENTEQPVNEDSVVTFSLKVDTASYSNVERYVQSGSLPPADAVKVEEMINYFNYESPVDFDGHPLGVYTEVAPSPFETGKYMAFIRVKAQEADKSELPPSNLVFLIDTSGSMDSYDKLPLLKDAFTLLADTLGAGDRVSIVTYAGSSAVALSGAGGDEKHRILGAIYGLEAGGSTAGADGIRTAYELAWQNFIPGGNNRIILATDGDFNVGISDTDELERFIGTKRGEGIYLSTLGFGTGNLRDDMMETLAKHGDGNYSYINSVNTANKVLVEEMGSNLFAVADDVKAQVEFNPANVKNYRLVGYENRQLADSDFSDDAKDAGEIGVGTDVVVMFELELDGNGNASGGLKYGGNADEAPAAVGTGGYADELFEVRIRYKNPGGSESGLILNPVTFDRVAACGSADFNFACTVAEWGAQLRNSDYAAYAPPEELIAMAQTNLGSDTGGYRGGFADMLYNYGYAAGY